MECCPDPTRHPAWPPRLALSHCRKLTFGPLSAAKASYFCSAAARHVQTERCEASVRLIPLLLRRLRLQQYVLLCVGLDPELLQLRRALLRSAGYRVQTESNPALTINLLMSGDFDLIILCHTISDDDRWRLISDIRSLRQSMPIVVLRANGQTLLHKDEVHSLDGQRH